MTPFPILDLVAGMIFLYFLMSVLSNSVIEGLVAISSIKSKLLTKWIGLNLPHLKNHFLNHTLLDGRNKKRTSSYISPANFAFVLIDAITKEAGKLPDSLSNIEAALNELESGKNTLLPDDLIRVLKIFIAEAREKAKIVNQTKTELELFRHSIEVWFDSMMERLGGTFKKWTARWTLAIAVTTVLSLNLDSVQIAKYLYADKDARNALASAAFEAAKDPEMKDKARSVTEIIDSVANAPDTVINGNTITVRVKKNYKFAEGTVSKIASFIPIGWNIEAEQAVYRLERTKNNSRNIGMTGFWFQKIFGFLMTIFAVMLGTPFWFDVLGRVANLRSSIKPGKAE